MHAIYGYCTLISHLLPAPWARKNFDDFDFVVFNHCLVFLGYNHFFAFDATEELKVKPKGYGMTAKNAFRGIIPKMTWKFVL